MREPIQISPVGYWGCDGVRCERATLMPDLPKNVIGVIHDFSVLDRSRVQTVYEYRLK